MTPHRLVHELARAGITLHVDKAGLHVVGDSIPGPLLPHLRQHKQILVAMLADGRYARAEQDVRDYESWLREPWGDPRWINVDSLLALFDRPCRPIPIQQVPPPRTRRHPRRQ